jgi:hypothetical protein
LSRRLIVLDQKDEKEVVREMMLEIGRLKEELEELRFLKFMADEIRGLRKRLLKRPQYD